jgi:hypothetical protein
MSQGIGQTVIQNMKLKRLGLTETIIFIKHVSLRPQLSFKFLEDTAGVFYGS